MIVYVTDVALSVAVNLVRFLIKGHSTYVWWIDATAHQRPIHCLSDICLKAVINAIDIHTH